MGYCDKENIKLARGKGLTFYTSLGLCRLFY